MICSSHTVKYYCEVNIYQLVVKVTANMAVNSMLECNEFNLAEVNGIIFQLRDCNYTGT